MTTVDLPSPTFGPSVAPARNRRAYVVGAIVVVALGFVVFRGLGNATLFFRTASDAVAQMEKLGERRFRIQGVVVEGSVKPTSQGTDFTIQENGVDVVVRHRGDPPELFKANVPVVLEGHFAPGSTAATPLYDSDRILVKHSNEYGSKNPDRVEQYDK